MIVHTVSRFMQCERYHVVKLLSEGYYAVSYFSQKRCIGNYGAPKVGPSEVSAILRNYESTHVPEPNSCVVGSVDINFLPSNNPIEDRLIAASTTNGEIYAVFDGHGGFQMASLVSQRLIDYIALATSSSNVVEEYATRLKNTESQPLSQVLYANDDLTPEERVRHADSLQKFATDVAAVYGSMGGGRDDVTTRRTMQQRLEHAFLALDDHISQEICDAVDKKKDAMKMIERAVQGCVGCVVHVVGPHLHVASTGDCKAVLGVLEGETWTAVSLSKEHNCDNIDEIRRIMSEHPESERNHVIKHERLLGQLAPSRAFGDFNFKWPLEKQQRYLIPVYGNKVVPGSANNVTFPYLTARPEVNHHVLRPRDKFLVIASDGLWEQMMPHKVVKYIGQHMSGKQTLDLLRLPRPAMRLKDIQTILLQRKKGLLQKPMDSNAATHLIRNALGRTEYGIEHSKLAALLSLPKEVTRNFRDDISVMILFFDSDFLSQISSRELEDIRR